MLAPLVSGPGLPTFSELVWGVLAGLSGLAGLGLLYTGLGMGKVAIVSPVSALISATIPSIYGALSGEKPGPTALAGAILCVPAILLLAWDRDDDPTDKRTKLALSELLSLSIGIAAGLFLGAFYVFIANCGESAGLWPLAGARATALATLGLFFVIRKLVMRRSERKNVGRGKTETGFRQKSSLSGSVGDAIPVRESRERSLATAAALGGGFLDISANLAFLYASRTGLLMLVSVVTSLYPAPTIMLARVYFKEKLPPHRIAGLALALAGIILVGIQP